MSVRKRTWTTSKGVEKEAWVVDYVERSRQAIAGSRLSTKKKAATTMRRRRNVEIRAGVHTADSQSVTVSEAGRLWIVTGKKNRLERSTLTMYRQQLSLHIAPYLGNVKLSQLSAPMVREFETISTRWTLGGDGAQGARFAFIVGLRRIGTRSCHPQRGARASREAKAGQGAEGGTASARQTQGRRRIPTREEIRAIVEAA